MTKSIRSYLNNDFKSKNNANERRSIAGMESFLIKDSMSEFTREIYSKYAPEAIKAHDSGDIYIHNLSDSCFRGYCAGWSLLNLMGEGLDIPFIVKSKPPRHLDSALDQLINFLAVATQEWSGAQAFSNFDTLMAPFVRNDQLSYRQVKQAVQRFVFNCNYPFRSGFQSPFVNVTLDMKCPKTMEGAPCTVGNKTYGDLNEEIGLVDTALFEVLSEGDSMNRPFPFPIPTVKLLKGREIPDDYVHRKLFELAAWRGSPYFMPVDDEDIAMAMCCHLKIDRENLVRMTNGVWATGVNTGSVGVVDINMPRLGLACKSFDEVVEHVDRLVEDAGYVLDLKRSFVRKSMESGMLPISKRYLGTLDNHFNTISWIGVNEFWRNFNGTGIEENIDDTIRLMRHINDAISSMQGWTGAWWNFEASPAETASPRLAHLDYEKFEYGNYFGELKRGMEYSAGTSIPRDSPIHLWDQMKIEGRFAPLYTGGMVKHIFFDESIDSRAVGALTRMVVEKTDLGYFSWTPTIGVCGKCSSSFIGSGKCPRCGAECEHYTRVVGYYSPVSRFNPAKVVEYEKRRMFNGEV